MGLSEMPTFLMNVGTEDQIQFVFKSYQRKQEAMYEKMPLLHFIHKVPVTIHYCNHVIITL